MFCSVVLQLTWRVKMNIEQIKQQAISMRSLMKDGGIWIQHNPFPSVIKHQAIDCYKTIFSKVVSEKNIIICTK